MTAPNNATHEAATAAFSFSTTPRNTMNYATHNTATIDYNFTSLQGYVDAKYDELVTLFGKPTNGDAYKVDAQWILKFEDGEIATIYNYKNGKNYNGAEGLAVEQIDNWHIGGHKKLVADRVQIILDLHREAPAKDEGKDPVDQAFESAYEVMETLRKVKGAAYARTVETGMITRKQIDMFHLLLGIAVNAADFPESAADMLNEMFSKMCAKQISLCAKNGELTKDNISDAEELMSWVDKMLAHEQSAAKEIMAMVSKGGKTND